MKESSRFLSAKGKRPLLNLAKAKPAALLATMLLLTACGGSDDGTSDGGGSERKPFFINGGSSDWKAGEYKDAEQFANQCENPRTGSSPVTRTPYPDTKGDYRSENNFLRSWSNDTYLWYKELPDLNPANYKDTLQYFDLLKTNAVTPSGAPKDQFHFTYDSDEWELLSESGITYGYGLELSWISTTPPRELIVAYTQPGSPAAEKNILRGAKLLKIDGVDLVSGNTEADINKLNSGIYPAAAGEVHTFLIQEQGAASPREVILQSASVTSVPVQNVKTIDTATGKVGYLTFNDHIATAERGLVDAISQLDAAGINDLVVDLRYNGGGYLAIASQLAYMIAGASPTSGKTFEQLQFNDKYPTKDPVTGAALDPEPFYSTSLGFSVSQGQALPTLDLPRVFVLTSGDTCSASEALINGLRGVGIEVIQIGRTTCGKPYGFYAQPNCGTTYFTVQFRGVNAKNFGDYSDGFVPSLTDDGKARVRGCSVADDFSRALGDASEKRLAAALYYRTNNACPSASSGGMKKASVPEQSLDGVLIKERGLQNRIMRQ
ncbi:MAG TPA: S41 family peptidase [Cellvibrio sp.]|nr:S41 family peptidase [Cellvibrio sp.]